MKQQVPQELFEGCCPRCGIAARHAPWPYLKGTLAHPSPHDMTWYKCLTCNTLFSELTPVAPHGPAPGEVIEASQERA
jgi:rubredoxin